MIKSVSEERLHDYDAFLVSLKLTWIINLIDFVAIK